MSEGVKSAVISAVVAAVLGFFIGQYQNNQARAQTKLAQQTEEQKKAMLDFTQTLETLTFNLEKEDYQTFEANANKLDERMKRSEFAPFLDYREKNPPDSGFDKQVSTLNNELYNFRHARQSYIETRARIDGLLTRFDLSRQEPPNADSYKNLVVNAVQPPSSYIALDPLRSMTEQLRFEMRLRDQLGN